MQQAIVQTGQFHSVLKQPLHNVLVYAPTIIWVKKGYKQLLWRDNALEFDQKDWLVVPANQYLTFTNMTRHDIFYSQVLTLLEPPPEQWLQDETPLPRSAEPRIKTTEALIYCFNMLTEMADKNLSIETQKQLLLGFYQALRETNQLTLLFPNAVSHLSEKIARYLSNSPGEDHKLDIVAAHFSMSRATLIRKLASEGSSFRQILTEIRMGYALSLLQESKSQLDVSLACGYQSQSRFSSRFTQQFGLTPRQYANTLSKRQA
ncbi:helix-turn-helix transcriptional regulator [Pseudomonas sp. HK3]